MKDLREAAYNLLLTNARQGKTKEGEEYFYVCPSPGRYPHQWFWDSCFHAISMSNFNVDLAKKELKTLISCTGPDGFLPHIIYWQNSLIKETWLIRFFYNSTKFTRLTQPPLIGVALEKIYEKDNDKAFLKNVLPAVTKFYEWIKENRIVDKTELPFIIHPWESGMDESPQFDPVLGLKKERFHLLLKYKLVREQIKLLIRLKKLNWNVKTIGKEKRLFLVKNCLFNSIYALGLRSIAHLWEKLGEREKHKRFLTLASKTEQAILKYHYDPELKGFVDLWGTDNIKIPIISISSLSPLILDNIPLKIIEELIKELLLEKNNFWTPYPVPTVPKNSPYFDPKNHWPLWRGPVSINTNWLVFLGLQKHGYKDIAFEIAKKTKRMIEKSQFREFYSPLTGEGIGARNYSWSTLIVDMML